MKSEEWEKRVEEFLGEIAADENLSDQEYVEVMEDIESRARASADAKREELDDK